MSLGLPHSGHLHSLSESVRDAFWNPQAEQGLGVAVHCPTCRSWRVCFWHLYARISTNSGKARLETSLSPVAFHCIEIQVFNSDRVKPSAKIGGEFPVPVKALKTDFLIQTRKLPNGAPPVARAFLLATDTFAEGSQCAQRFFENLRDVYLFTGAQCQESVLPYRSLRLHFHP